MECKTCTKCGEVKEASAKFFHQMKRNKDGLNSVCKVCYKQKSKQYYLDNKERIKKRTNQYRLDHLEYYKQYNEQYNIDNAEYLKQQKAQNYEDNKEYYYQRYKQWAEDNPERIKQHKKKYLDNNPDKCKAAIAKWAKNNRDKRNAAHAKRRVMKKNQTAELTQLEQERYSFIYEVCQTMADYHVDHIQPIDKGGSDHPDNLQILHKTLNLSKGNKWPLTPEEEIRYRGYRIGR